MCGTEAGVIMVLLFNPLWVVRTRLSLQGLIYDSKTHQPRHYTGLVDALKTIYLEEGVRGLYRGLGPALILTSHGSIQFAAYEELKKMAENYLSKNSDQQQQQHAFVSMVLGATSKIFASTITYPYQVIKSRLQQRNNAPIETNRISPEANIDITEMKVDTAASKLKPKYKNSLDCMIKIWRCEGLKGFFRGVVPNALKVAPSAAITFVIYEEMMKIMNNNNN